jgi:hypothetical protein
LGIEPETVFREGQSRKKNMKRHTLEMAIISALGAILPITGSANLVINGDFQAGNTGFTSGYKYVAPGAHAPSGNANTLWDEGTYSVGTDPHSFHSSWASFGDNTTGTGKMLIVNGAGSAVTVWQGTLSSTLIAGATYQFSAWVANLYPPAQTPLAPAQLSFSVGNAQIGAVYTAPDVGIWHQFTTTFVAGSEPIAVLDLNTVPNGNDFALDDISLDVVAVPEPATMLAGALLLLPFGASTIRVLRKKIAA